MSSNKEDIRAFFESRKKQFKVVSIAEDRKVKIKKLSLAELEAIHFEATDTEKNIETIAKLYFSVDTEEQLFDKDYLRNIANEDLLDLYMTAIKSNGATEKEAEKN